MHVPTQSRYVVFQPCSRPVTICCFQICPPRFVCIRPIVAMLLWLGPDHPGFSLSLKVLLSVIQLRAPLEDFVSLPGWLCFLFHPCRSLLFQLDRWRDLCGCPPRPRRAFSGPTSLRVCGEAASTVLCRLGVQLNILLLVSCSSRPKVPAKELHCRLRLLFLARRCRLRGRVMGRFLGAKTEFCKRSFSPSF